MTLAGPSSTMASHSRAARIHAILTPCPTNLLVLGRKANASAHMTRQGRISKEAGRALEITARENARRALYGERAASLGLSAA